MKTDLFDYTLPEELIAFHPPEKRDGGRLMVVTPGQVPGQVVHSRVAQLGDHLPKGALLIFNDTRVIPARIYGKRPTGGQVEVLFVRPQALESAHSDWIVLARANRPLKPGDTVVLDDMTAEVRERRDRGETLLRVPTDEAGLLGLLHRSGEVPLPPYIRRSPEASDKERYQTTYARVDGSVAAPTAGLHFTEDLLSSLRSSDFELGYVTLHVGPGTFRPIVGDDLGDHRMDEERYEISHELMGQIEKAKAESRPIIAVGTTTVRALEGAAASGNLTGGAHGLTELFITPGFEFQVVDGLITNFHLPKSTLICLVSALASREEIMAAYECAVDEQYRFYSYGDAMLILPRAR